MKENLVYELESLKEFITAIGTIVFFVGTFAAGAGWLTLPVLSILLALLALVLFSSRKAKVSGVLAKKLSREINQVAKNYLEESGITSLTYVSDMPHTPSFQLRKVWGVYLLYVPDYVPNQVKYSEARQVILTTILMEVKRKLALEQEKADIAW